MSDILIGLFEYLDINSTTGLATEKNLKNMTSYQKLFYKQAHEKVGIDAVYFLRDNDGIANIPLIYFSAIQQYDAKQVAELHRLSWNLGEAPLLFIVTPDEILIYNNYKTPKLDEEGDLDPKTGLIETLSLANGLVTQQTALRKYHRSLLESGEYWRQSKNRFSASGRVDSMLLENLKIMRKALIEQIESRSNISTDTIANVVHSLIIRSVFIKYLEERKDSNGETVFPHDFFSGILESAKQYTDILANKEATYILFNVLNEKFRGDVLRITEEEKKLIVQEDLDELRTFMLGDIELKSQQYTMWSLYNFDIIPIQLISNIYELFFHHGWQRDSVL